MSIPGTITVANWRAELWIDALAEAFREPPVPRAWRGLPALGQLTITRPELLRPFEAYNEAHSKGPVRPFNFISVAYPKPLSRAGKLRLVAPFTPPNRAVEAEWHELHSGGKIEITIETFGGEIRP